MKNYGTLLIVLLASSPLLAMETFGMKFRGKTPAKVESDTAAVVAKVRTHPALDLHKAVLNKDPKKVRSLLKENHTEVLDQLDDALALANDTAAKLDAKLQDQTLVPELKDPVVRKVGIGLFLIAGGLYTIANGVYVPAEGDSSAHVDWTTGTSNIIGGSAATVTGGYFIYQGVTGTTSAKFQRALEIVHVLNEFSKSQSVLEELTKRKSVQAAIITKSGPDRITEFKKERAELLTPTASPTTTLVTPPAAGVSAPADNNSNNQ